MPTILEFVQKAQTAIADGKLEEADVFTNQAKALKALEDLQPAAVSPELTELRAMKAKLEAEPAVKSGGTLVVVEDEADRAIKGKPFSGLGDFLTSVKSHNQGNFDQRLLSLRSSDPADEGGFNMAKAIGQAAVGSLFNASQKGQKAITGLGTQVGNAGGFLVDTENDMSIMERVYNNGDVLKRIDLTGISAGSNGMTFNAEDETSRANGSRRGGIRGYWMGEGSAYTASAPKFRQIELKLKKAGALVYATDEMLADSTALESYIMRNLPGELRFVVEDSIINGSGAGQPLGVLNSGAVVEVPKESGQAAATLTATNIMTMWSRRWVGATDYAWLINQDVTPQLYSLALDNGVVGQLVYMQPGGLSALPYGTLYGRPVLEVEYAQTLGTAGDIMLVSLNEYQAIDKGGIQSASSIHVNFTTGEQVFRFTYRFDGEPKWASALTPKNGTATVSPYVTLATRS